MRRNPLSGVAILALIITLTGCGGQKVVEEDQKSNSIISNSEEIEWVTWQGGWRANAKVLFTGKDDVTIKKIIDLFNTGKNKRRSTEKEYNFHGPGPANIIFKFKNGSRIRARSSYQITEKKGPGETREVSAEPFGDRIEVFYENGDKTGQYTVFSKEVAAYLRDGWKKDIPPVKAVMMTPELAKEGQKITVKGDGCTEKEVRIVLSTTYGERSSYLVGRVIPSYGAWTWEATINRHFQTLGGKFDITLEPGEYDLLVRIGDSEYGAGKLIIK